MGTARPRTYGGQQPRVMLRTGSAFAGPLEVDPGGPYTVQRATLLTLRARRPAMAESYRWTFSRPSGATGPLMPVETQGLSAESYAREQLKPMEAVGALPAAAQPRASAAKLGREVRVFVLDDLDVELTVTRADGVASAKTRIQVKARPNFQTGWKQAQLVERWKDKPLAVLAKALGTNVCSVGHTAGQVVGHLIHRPDEGGSAGGTYTLATVSDPDGPFDGYAYVKEHALRVERKIYMNEKLMKADAGGKAGEVYQHNRSLGGEYADGVEALRLSVIAHEELHGALIRDALKVSLIDPGPRLETLYAPDRETVSLVASEMVDAAERVLEFETHHVKLKAAMPAKHRRPAKVMVTDGPGQWSSWSISDLTQLGDDA